MATFCFYILTKNQQICQIKKMATTKNNIDYYIMKILLVHLNAYDSSLANLTEHLSTKMHSNTLLHPFQSQSVLTLSPPVPHIFGFSFFISTLSTTF